MSLRSVAAVDFSSILDSDNEDVTLTKPASGEDEEIEYSVKGFVNRTDITFDIENGGRLLQSKTAVTVSLVDLDGEEPEEDWSISTTDVMGNTISGKVISPNFDRTLGRVTMYIEVVD